MVNEIVFALHILAISISCAIAARLKKEALVALVCVQAIIANIFVTKQIILGSFCITCTDVFTIGCGLSLNLLQELYDKKTAIRTIFISFFCLFFYVVMSQIHLWYTPATCDTMHIHFAAILEAMPRIIGASLISYFASQSLDAWLYGYLKTTRLPFIIRNYGSLGVSQLIDTVAFSFLGLYGLVDNIYHIVIISYAAKLVTIAISIPCTRLIINLLTWDKQKS